MPCVFYFSGVASLVEANCFRLAGVDHVLVDPVDLKNADGFGHVVLDSGAYRASKRGRAIDIAAYKALGASERFAWHIAPDVIGDHAATHLRWEEHKQPRMVPVWPWGADEQLLSAYLAESALVAVGGLVNLMREKNQAMYRQLRALCERYPGRLHLLGANWLRVINDLHGCAASMDSSKVLDAARFGHVFFVHDRTHKLHVAPARVMGRGHLSREERIVESARAMNEYLNRPAGACGVALLGKEALQPAQEGARVSPNSGPHYPQTV